MNSQSPSPQPPGRPGKFWAWVAIIAGLALLTCGAVISLGFYDLAFPDIPFVTAGAELLIERLGWMAAMFLGLGCGSLAFYHGRCSILNRPSRRFTLPPPYIFWITFAVVLGLGNLLLIFEVAAEFLFPPMFLLGAALPTLGVLAWSGRRLGWPITWRQGALSFVSGSTLSIIVTILLGSVLPFLIYMLIEPMFYSTYNLLILPEMLFFVIFTALQAPIPEEFAKALGPGLMGRRIKNERQAFFVGIASGAGFAILENMLYQGIYAWWSGWTWGGVTLLRGIGIVLHPLGTGIIALALFRARSRPKGWFGQLLRAYLLSVGLHTLWNGGFDLFLYYTGLSFYSGGGLSVYGEPISILLIAFLLLLSAGLWWLLHRYVTLLAEDEALESAPMVVSPRAVAIWAFACALVIVPIGAAFGRAWDTIKAAILGGG